MSATTQAEIHPYFMSKAREALRTAGADEDASVEALARWGESAHHAGIRGRAGVIVDRSGRLLAETVCRGVEPSAWYIASALTTEVTIPVPLELGLAMAQITRSLREQAGPEGPCTDETHRGMWCSGTGPCLLPREELVHITAGQFTGSSGR